MSIYQDRLAHYGVVGMKWGVRRYQPYPKGYSGDGKYLPKDFRLQTKEVLARKEADIRRIADIQRWDDKQRRSIISARRWIARSKVAATKVKRILEKTDDSSGFSIKRSDRGANVDVRSVNPSFGDGTASSGNNCALCTVAFDLRRRGFDVMAKQHAPINLLYDVSSEDIRWMYKGAKEAKTGSSANLISKLSAQPEGSRGAAFCRWKDSPTGHVVSYIIENKKVVLYDAQSGKRYTDPKKMFDENAVDTTFMRLDNVKPNYVAVRLAVE